MHLGKLLLLFVYLEFEVFNSIPSDAKFFVIGFRRVFDILHSLFKFEIKSFGVVVLYFLNFLE